MKGTIKIVAIGGGEIGRPGYPIETRGIDIEIIKLTQKQHPRVLLLPTASGDSELYWETFHKYFGKKLGCKTDVLYLIKSKPSIREIKEKIFSSNCVYVGGGNTLRMLKIWRRYGVDEIFEKAARKGLVLSGISAGAICWFKYGNSDSLKFGPSKSNKLIRIRGLGLVGLMICPHYNVEKNRRPSLRKMIKIRGGVAIALDNCSALEIVGDKYKVITSSRRAKAYRLYKKEGKVVEETLVTDKELKPLEQLFEL